MSWTSIDDDLENKEKNIFLIGLLAAGVSIMVLLSTPETETLRVIVSFTSVGMTVLLFMMSLVEIEKRGQKISDLRKKPDRIEEVRLLFAEEIE